MLVHPARPRSNHALLAGWIHLLLRHGWIDVHGDLRAEEFEDDVSLGLPLHLHLYDVAYVEVGLQRLHGLLFPHDSTHPNVQRAVHAVLHVVLDERLDYLPDVQLAHTLDLLVDERILCAQRGVSHYLVKHCDLLIVLDSELVVLVNNLEVAVLTLHPLVDLWEVEDVLRRVLDHVLVQGPPLPETVIVTHLVSYYSLLGVRDVYVMLEQFRQGDVVILTINQFRSLLEGLLDHSVGDLGVEYEVAEHVELVGEG